MNIIYQPIIWFSLMILFITILLFVSKRSIKNIFSMFNVDEIWYKVLDIVYSVLKVILIAGVIIFVASRIIFHDVSIKSYNTDIDTQAQKYNNNLTEQYKQPDSNQIQELNNKLNMERKSTLEDREREESRKSRDDFDKFLDSII